MDPSPSPLAEPADRDPAAEPPVAPSIPGGARASAGGGRPWSLTSLRIRGVPVLTLFLLGFSLSVIVTNFLPTRAATAANDRALEAQRAQNRELAERIRYAESEADRLEHDPWRHERILRDELRMSRQGEVIIR